MRIEIVSTGDEVITGSIDDTNASFLSRELSAAGIEVNRRHTAGDTLSELKMLFAEIADRHAVVLVTGGLGPTGDDLTAQAAAECAGVPLCEHPEWVEHMRRCFEQRGRVMSPSNLKQAMLPSGSLMINNSIGTACGFAMKIKNSLFIFAPGVPRELKLMWEKDIKAMVLSLAGNNQATPLAIRKFNITGIGESNLTEILNDINLPDGITFGDRSVYPIIELKLTSRNNNQEQLDACHELVGKVLERFIITDDRFSIDERLKQEEFMPPEISLRDNVTNGRLMLELQKLNIPVISSVVVNSECTAEDTDIKAESAAEENYIHLTADTKEGSTVGIRYILEFSLNCKEKGKPRLISGRIIFNFDRAPAEYIRSRRHQSFISILIICEMFKLTVREKLILPEECTVELQSIKDSMYDGEPYNPYAAEDPERLLKDTNEKLSDLNSKNAGV